MTRPMRIALADDEVMLRDLMTLWLTELGHEVTCAGDGRELVAVCGEIAPDLVISDVQMPRLDGIAAVLELRRGCNVPVILASSAWTAERTRQAVAVGAVCVDKPLRPLTLLAAINRACGVPRGSGGRTPRDAAVPRPPSTIALAHEARNALTCLLNYAMWLQKQEIDPAIQAVGVKVGEQARHLARLVEELQARPKPALDGATAPL